LSLQEKMFEMYRLNAIFFVNLCCFCLPRLLSVVSIVPYTIVNCIHRSSDHLDVQVDDMLNCFLSLPTDISGESW